MKTTPIINKALARKVLAVVNKGLVSGLGQPTPGKMCVEAAVNYAMGAPHGDQPSCVGEQVRNFKIALNDSYWSSNKARTAGLRKLAIAQLGSDALNQNVFLKKLDYRCMTNVLPLIVENAMKEDKDNEFVKKNVDMAKLKVAVEELKSAQTFEMAKKATKKIRDVYYASAPAYASASASAPAPAPASAYASAYAYTSAYAYASAYASASAPAPAPASAYAYTSASAYTSKNPKFTDKTLNLIAKQGLDTLKEMKSPGVKWLDLCE